MDEIILIKPTIEYSDQIEEVKKEILNANDHDSFAGCGGLEECSSIDEWLERIERLSDPETTPEGHVSSDMYIAVRVSDKKIVGIIDLRHHIDHPILGTWGGHIGYTVRPSERGKGYGKTMLSLNLENCKKRSIEKVLVTCHDGNIASEKIITSNGGVFEKQIVVDDETVKRFWIEL